MARRQPKTLLEVNVLLAAGSLLTPEQRSAGKKLPVMAQARLMAKAMRKASRVGEFIAMWAIAKYESGEVTVETAADYWNEAERTMYRRLDEFREVWGPAGYETPDRIADNLIADYRARKERLTATHLARLLGAPITVPVTTPVAVS